MAFKLCPPGLQLNMQGPVLEVEEAEDVTQTVLVADVHEMTEGVCLCLGLNAELRGNSSGEMVMNIRLKHCVRSIELKLYSLLEMLRL